MGKYIINGRYLADGNLDGYYLIDNTGKSIKASVKYVKRLAKSGDVTNAKVQVSVSGKELLRGIGINLTKLRVMPNKSSGVQEVGNIELSGIIRKQEKIVGYTIENKGKRFNISVKKCEDLCEQCQISNAELVSTDTGKEIVVDSDYEIKDFIVDKNKVLWNTKDKDLLVRAMMIKEGCIINGESVARKSDYLVVKYDGTISILNGTEFMCKYSILRDENLCTLCDTELKMDFEIVAKTFSEQVEVYKADDLLEWLICKPNNYN